ncbi:MAG TPA: hypothetical protein VGE13_00420 [Candidatus Saccharimonadales bacterium]
MKRKLSIIVPSILALTLAVGVVLPVSALDTTETTRMSREQRLAEREARMAKRQEARKAKLDQRRLEICEKREQRINTILTHGVERSKKHMAVFDKISERVQAFYTKKNLSADGYDAAVATVNEKRELAVTAIETSAATTFDCDTTDASHPGQTVREEAKTRRTALKDYRSAIKDLILVVKKGHGQQNTNTTGDRNEEKE